MARLWSCGFELNSVTDGIETQGGGGGSIVTTPVHAGTYSYKVDGVSGIQYQSILFKTANDNGPFFARTYFYIESAPNVNNDIFELDQRNGTTIAYLQLKTDRTIQLIDEDGSIGSPSSALNLNQWYMLEMKVDRRLAAGSHIVEFRLDGTVVATSSTRNLATGFGSLAWGSAVSGEALTSGIWYFDDIAINDGVGTKQNSYPNQGYIVHLRPNADGDTSEWLADHGGSHYVELDEVTPDDISTNIFNSTAGLIDDLNVDATPSDIATNADINVVQVGIRFQHLNITGSTKVSLRLKRGPSAPVETGNQIAVSDGQWYTHVQSSLFAPLGKQYQLTSYAPPGKPRWTKALLDTAQIGVIQVDTSSVSFQVSTLWLLVEYYPSRSIQGASTITSPSTIQL